MAEDDIGRFEDKDRSHGQSFGRRDNRFHPHKRLDRQTQEQRSGKNYQHGNSWVVLIARRKVVNRQTSFPHVRPGVNKHINDNYCVSVPMCRWLIRGKETVKILICIGPTGTDRTTETTKRL